MIDWVLGGFVTNHTTKALWLTSYDSLVMSLLQSAGQWPNGSDEGICVMLLICRGCLDVRVVCLLRLILDSG